MGHHNAIECDQIFLGGDSNIVQVDFGVLWRGISIKHYLDQNAMSIILPAGKS